MRMALRINRLPLLSLHPGYCAYFSASVGKQDRRVNAWTQWGKLKEICVGNADFSCFPPVQPAIHPKINSDTPEDEQILNIQRRWHGTEWPTGLKNKQTIENCNNELNGLVNVLEGEGVRVLRPEVMDWSKPIKTPFWEVPTQYGMACPRDSLVTIGNIVIESPVSRRDRFFETSAMKKILRELWRTDENMLWKAAPQPDLNDEHYDDSWWRWSQEKRYAQMHEYQFCINDLEPIFDAADIMRAGKDIFVQESMTCNKAGIQWLTRELRPYGVRVHTVKFPYDFAPSHLDCTFVFLRPGLVLTNPDRPIAAEDAEIFHRNGWKFVDAPPPDNPVRPAFSQSSKWLSMNILVAGEDTVICEAQERTLQDMLRHECGFSNVIAVPFRNVYEFGGSLHCATWETEREDQMMDLFPNQ